MKTVYYGRPMIPNDFLCGRNGRYGTWGIAGCLVLYVSVARIAAECNFLCSLIRADSFDLFLIYKCIRRS